MPVDDTAKSNQLTDSPSRMATDMLAQGVTRIALALKAFLFLPIISKSLGAEAYGIWTQVLVTVTLLAPVIQLRLDTASVRFLAAKPRTEANAEYVSLFLAVCVSSVVFGFCLLIGRSVAAYAMFGDPSLVRFAVLLVPMLVMYIVSDFLLAYFRTMDRIKLLSLLQILRATAEVLIVALVVLVYKADVYCALLAMLLVGSAFLAFTGALAIAHLGRIRPASLRTILPYFRYAIPLVPTAALFWTVNFADRFVIAHYLGLSDVAVYAAWYGIAQLVILVVGPIGYVLFPTLSRLWGVGNVERARAYFEQSIRATLIISIPIAFGIWAGAPTLIQFITTSEFVASDGLAAALVGSMLFVGLYQLWAYTIHLHGKTGILLVIFVLVGSTNLGLNLLWVPSWGIMGAAISTLICYAMLFIFVVWAGRNVLTTRISRLAPLRLLVAGGVMAIVIRALNPIGVLSLVWSVAAGGAAYCLLIILLRVVTRQDYTLFRKMFTK